jgi:K+-transporting ATPase KdpF subunit
VAVLVHVGAALAALIAIYLVAALLKPEWF